jgi:hypothetical protein
MYESMESRDVDDEFQLMLRKPLARLADAVRNTH